MATDLYAAADPLVQPARAERVNYATGVLLQAEDFRDEQTYHRRRLALALRHLAGFGTLAGLAVRAPKAEDNDLELRVEPGVALDRYGRLIEVGEPWCIHLARWFVTQDTTKLIAALHPAPRTPFDLAVVADIFLSAKDCGRGMTPSFAQGPFDALDALVPARLAEEPAFELVLRAEDGTIPAPKNHWPAPSSSREAKLTAVLGSWDTGLSGDLAEGLDPLGEHVADHELSAVLLARIAIPVTRPADAGASTPPSLDLTRRPSVDNGLRPFIYLPGKWLGRAPDEAPIVEPEEPTE